METTRTEPENNAVPTSVEENQNGASLQEEEKRAPSHDDDPDIERARSDVNQNPPMTFKRFMAIFSLGCLLAAAQIPIYLIGGALCKPLCKI